MGEQEFRKGPRKTHTLCTARECAVAVESCRGITQNNIPNLSHIGARFPSFLSRAFQPQTLATLTTKLIMLLVLSYTRLKTKTPWPPSQ